MIFIAKNLLLAALIALPALAAPLRRVTVDVVESRHLNLASTVPRDFAQLLETRAKKDTPQSPGGEGTDKKLNEKFNKKSTKNRLKSLKKLVTGRKKPSESKSETTSALPEEEQAQPQQPPKITPPTSQRPQKSAEPLGKASGLPPMIELPKTPEGKVARLKEYGLVPISEGTWVHPDHLGFDPSSNRNFAGSSKSGET